MVARQVAGACSLEAMGKDHSLAPWAVLWFLLPGFHQLEHFISWAWGMGWGGAAHHYGLAAGLLYLPQA